MVVENKKEEIAEVDLKDWWEAIKVGYKNADNKNCHIDLKELTSRQYKVFMKDIEKEGLYGMYKKAKLGAMKGGVVGRMIGGIGGGIGGGTIGTVTGFKAGFAAGTVAGGIGGIPAAISGAQVGNGIGIIGGAALGSEIGTKIGVVVGAGVAVTEKPLKETLRYGAQQGSCILQEKNPELHKKVGKFIDNPLKTLILGDKIKDDASKILNNGHKEVKKILGSTKKTAVKIVGKGKQNAVSFRKDIDRTIDKGYKEMKKFFDNSKLQY